MNKPVPTTAIGIEDLPHDPRLFGHDLIARLPAALVLTDVTVAVGRAGEDVDRAAARGVTLPGKAASDPKDLGKVLTDLHEKPGRLRDILGPGDGQPQGQAPGSNPLGDMLSSPTAKAVLAGIAAMVVKRMTGSSQT